nr:MAG TPA: hypothetical protein [Caudoviricetes sp.]DAR23576.1 MAG TPA: hypothetical protein [Caudoviricetes sp.]
MSVIMFRNASISSLVSLYPERRVIRLGRRGCDTVEN